MFTPLTWKGLSAGGGGGGGSGSGSIAIGGSTALGGVLSVVVSDVTGFTPQTFQWRRNGTNIAGANASTYTVTMADSGTSISCLVNGLITALAVPVIPDVTAPTLLSAAINFASRLDLSFSETLVASPLPATTAFSISGRTVSAVTISGSTVSLTPSVNFAPGDSVTVGYTQPGTNRLRDAAGNNTASFSNQAVANNLVSEGAVSTFANSLYDPQWVLDSGTDAKTQPALTLPAKTTNILTGGYRDPVFDTEIRVVTDASEVGIPGNTAAVHDYSSQQAFNANSTYFNIQSINGFHYIVDSTTNQVLNMGGTNPQGPGAIPGMAGNCEPNWHPTDPNILFYTANGGSLIRYQFNISTKSNSVYADLTALVRAQPGMSNAGKAWSIGEGRPSDDGNRWGFLVTTATDACLGMVVYEHSTNSILRSWLFSSSPNWVSISPSGQYVVASWYGSSAGSLAAETARSLDQKGGANLFKVSDGTHQALSCIGEHSDMAWDYEGNEVYFSISFSEGDGLQSNSCVYARRLSDPSIVYEYALRIAGNSTGSQMHFSGRAIRRKGWGLCNKSPGVGSGPWDGAVMAIELVPPALNPKIYRLFQHRSAGGDQFSSPVATVNNDFTRVLAHTQDAQGRNIDLCCILPSFALGVAGARPPVALTAPVVSGSSAPGGTLTTTTGTYGGLPASTVTRVWQQSADGTTGWTTIAGQTGTSYVVGVANGVYVSVLETAANGSSPNATQRSNVVRVAALAAPVNTVAPSSPTTGQTDTPITAVAGTWTGNPTPTIDFVWQRNISGTWTDSAFTTRTATLTPVGTWRPKETATNSQGTVVATGASVTITVPATEPVANTSLSLTAANGTTLEALNAAWDGASTEYVIQNNRILAAVGWTANVTYYTASAGVNQAAKVVLAAGAVFGAGERQLVHIHATSATQGYSADIDATSVRLYRDSQQIGVSAAHGVNTASGTVTVEIRSLQGRVRVYIQGSATPAHDYTDPTPLTGGYPGISCYAGGTPTRIQAQEFAVGSS